MNCITLERITVLSCSVIIFFCGQIRADADVPVASDQQNTSENAGEPVDTDSLTGNAQPSPDTTDDTTEAFIDSLKREQIRDSLSSLESARRHFYHPLIWALTDSSPDISEIFRSDATTYYDISAFKPLFIAPRTGIANGFNHLLFMGNTSPVNDFYYGTRLIGYRYTHPYSIEQAFIGNEYGSLILHNDGTVVFPALQHSEITTPETVVFWENGVFDESILSFRASRPLSRTMQLSIFSHYQYFKDQKYSHDGNDIYTLYSNLGSDTTLLSHRGYNPLVKEFFCGADFTWKKNGSALFSKVKYGDLSDEIPSNRPFTDEHPTHFRMTQYPLLLQSTFTTSSPRQNSYYIAEGRCLLNHLIVNRLSSEQIAVRQKLTFSDQDITGALLAGKKVSDTDSADVTCRINRYRTGIPDSTELHSIEVHPGIRYKHSFSSGFVSGSGSAECGYNLFFSHQNGYMAPTWRASADFRHADYSASVFAEQDVNHYYPVFDSLETDSLRHDVFLRTGISFKKEFSLISATIGYQYYPNPDLESISRAWLNGFAPYNQPQSAFLFSIATSRFAGFSGDGRIMISDARPIVKTHAAVSYIGNPNGTRQSIEVNLCADYWSRRAIVFFADTTGWNREILDINLETAVHIKSFRLFYKVDNLLNRNYSYIPGYFAPGITFRWGFSWFIQR